VIERGERAERRAIRIMAQRAGVAESCFSPARAIEPETWYDFACPATGKYGQCRMRKDLTWSQEPRGECPVILIYKPSRRSLDLR
jgi:hypothetical protein